MARSLRGDGEIRTLDPLLARQVLSQLSYTPIWLLMKLTRVFFRKPTELKWAFPLWRQASFTEKGLP